MPLVYIAVHHDSIKSQKGVYDFKMLREHTERSDQIHVLRDFSSMDDGSSSLAYFSQRFHTISSLSGGLRSDKQEDYPIYCLDIPDQKYYDQFRAEFDEKKRHYMDIKQFTVVGYYTTDKSEFQSRQAKHCLVLNKLASEESRCQFYARLTQELKKVSEVAPPKIEFKSEIFPPIQQVSRIEKEIEKQKARRGKMTAWKVAGLITLLTLGGLLLAGVGGSLLLIFLLTTAMSSYLLYGCFVGLFFGGVVITGAGMACTSKTLVGVMRSDAEPEPTRDEILGNFSQPTSASSTPATTPQPPVATGERAEQENAFAKLLI